MNTTNTCIIRSVHNLQNYVVYLLDAQRHKNQEIIDNGVIKKTQAILDMAEQWKMNQESKFGARPKPLSIVLSFPATTPKNEFISLAMQRVHLWIKEISKTHDFQLNDDDIEKIVRSIPFVAHYKKTNPHVHFLFPKIFFNKRTNSYEYVNIYKYKYTHMLYKISGWNLEQKCMQEKFDLEQKSKKSSTLHLKDKLYEEIDHYKGLNDKLDKYITLLEKDLEKGHIDKAQKKLSKIRKQNGKIPTV